MAEMSYPLTCVVEGSKTAYLYRCLQLLMNMQNVFSKWYHEGLTELEWADGIPYQIRLLPQYGYVKQIDERLMKRFLNEEYYPRSHIIEMEIGKRRASHKQSDRWAIDINEIPKFDFESV